MNDTRQTLIVESLQILQRAAAAHQQQNIAALLGIGLLQRGDQLFGRRRALHAAGVNP